MIKTNTLLRVAYTLGVSLILSGTAFAQADRSVLNFARTTVNDRTNAGIAVTNPSTNYADVEFTLYGNDGNPVTSGLVNPVRYRVVPRGQISMMAGELFAAVRAEGWIQATSSTAGLLGYYVTGDFRSSLEGAEASPALTSQIIPVLRQDQRNRTEIIVLNPGTNAGTVTIALYNEAGLEVGTAVNRNIGPHAALRLPLSSLVPNLSGANLSARISSSIPVSATASIDRNDSILLAGGQEMNQLSSVRIAPDFIYGNGFDSVLVLTNPTGSRVSVTVTLHTESGASYQNIFTIPVNGSIALDAPKLTPFLLPPSMRGWISIESPNVALSGMVILDQGQTVTALPLQAVPLDRFLYSQISENDQLYTGIVLINGSLAPADVSLSLVGPDGTTFGQAFVEVSPNSKYSAVLSELIPRAIGRSGYVHIRSSIPIWSTAIIGARSYEFLASMPATRITDAFVPGAISLVPAITTLDPGTAIRPGSQLRVTVTNTLTEPVFSIAGQTIQGGRPLPGLNVFTLTVPASTEPGFVKLRARSNGIDSTPITLHVLPADSQPTQRISGQAFYQKIDVSEAGLDLNRPVMVPIRNGRVEVFDRVLQALIAVSDTDISGRFEVPVPMSASLTIRVVSRLRSGELRIADNTNAGSLYSISADIDAREIVGRLLLVDRSRLSGAFNILDVIQRGNDLVRQADPMAVFPSLVTIFWSERNVQSRAGSIAQGFVGTTYFNVSNNTAYVVGDRPNDSDEYDDSVILHEYAHMLAVRFSRDDSPGGAHSMGDILDPRLAWSEGWANFFSTAVLNDPVYRDSRFNGLSVRYNLEENRPVRDNPGYWSEASVGSLLWDLYDAQRPEEEENAQYSFALIWNAFVDLRNNRFIYLPLFLERFLDRTPASADALRGMVRDRNIEFQPTIRPSVTNPFPRIVDVGETVNGFVDSLTPKRTNLMQSSHFMSFTTGGGAASIRLDILSADPAGNVNANDLDLFLLDKNGRILARSDKGYNGESEQISISLSGDTYIVEVRSFYTNAETGGVAFNSGQYKLRVLVQ